MALGLEMGSLATTALSVSELLGGATSERSRDRVERLVSALLILPFDSEAARAAAGVRSHLEARGTPIGMADYLIAGICLPQSAPLLTRNLDHFARVPDLRLDPVFQE